MKCLLLAFAVAVGMTGCASEGDDAPSPCDECGPGTICVQLLSNGCNDSQVSCEPVVTGCEQPVCSQACDQAYCDPGGTSTCSAASCSIDIPDALQCYGV